MANDSSVQSRELPPYAPGKPYVISSQDGEIIYIPLSKSATRLLVTGKETEDAFAIVGSGGSHGDPIGFHYHREAHDVFLCLQGAINVWAGDQCRTMGPGDFASVPPGVIHQYQILGELSEMIGLIVPGGWEEFFRFIGEPYSGPMWPMQDDRNFFEVLLPRLKQAAEQFDMVPCPQYKSFDPQPWMESDNNLPGRLAPYFLKSKSGPAYVVGGLVCRPLITTAESHGKFAIGLMEGSCQHRENTIFTQTRGQLSFSTVHHAFFVVDGKVEAVVDGHPVTLHAGELVYVPKGLKFSLEVLSRFARFYAFSNGGGLVEMLRELGKPWSLPTLPERVEPWNADGLRDV
jgi:quercetin dioxygenase-like cupin family protein